MSTVKQLLGLIQPARELGQSSFERVERGIDLLHGLPEVGQVSPGASEFRGYVDMLRGVEHVGTGVGPDRHEASVAKQADRVEGGVHGDVVLGRELPVRRQLRLRGEFAGVDPPLQGVRDALAGTAFVLVILVGSHVISVLALS